MRTPEIDNALERTLSTDRLEKYLADSEGNLHLALTIYERNCRLSEAFYTPLQCVEICLRNTIHSRMTAAFGALWFDAAETPLLSDARDEIQYHKDQMDSEITPGRLVAEMPFAFWVSLLARRYDQSLWRSTLHRGFRGGRGVSRDKAHGRFNMLRRFRNRVAHHEPIYQRELQVLHNELIEAMSWMCRDTAAWAAHQSRFPQVFDGQA